MSNARLGKQPSFLKARKDLENQRSLDFEDGVLEGCRLQQASDANELKDARDELSLIRSQLETAQVECRRLKCTELGRQGRTSVADDRHLGGIPQEPYHLANITQSSHSTSFEVRSVSPAMSVVSDSYSFNTAPDEVPESPHFSSVFSTPSIPPETIDPARLPQPRPWKLSTTVQMTGQDGGESNQLVNVGSSTAPADLQAVESRGAVQTLRKHKPLKSIKEANGLMKTAHQAGQVGALTKVKYMVREAHRTPKAERTEIQKHLIAKWRTAEWDDGSYAEWNPRPKGAIPPSPDGPAEDWVAYYATLPLESPQLPRELRRDGEGQPLLSDVRALRTVARLQPRKSDGGNETRVNFKLAVARFFSVHGAYEDSLMRQSLNIAPSMTYAPYDGPIDSTDDIARHFALCGITDTVASNELGPWARVYLDSHPEVRE
jgi:hypothetical protein